jgi:hypothetical protein
MDNDKLIITILIQTHGTVIKTDLTSEEMDVFNDVILTSATCDFKPYTTTEYKESLLNKKIRNIFSRDIDKPIHEIMENLTPNNKHTNITFDKSLSIDESKNLFFRIQDYVYSQFFNPDGIYLISVHKGKKLIYPKNKKTVNILNIDHLKNFAKFFEKQIPNINQKSTILPVNSYIQEENKVFNDITLKMNEKDKKIQQIRKDFYNILSNWDLTINKNTNMITSIKLSVLIDLIKSIVQDDCIINLIDLSCNNLSMYIPNTQLTTIKYAFNTSDIENVLVKKYGGKKFRKNTSTKKKNKKSYKTRKNTM